ncbi:MAG: aminoacyl-tRNA hydrolase [bacterium]
MKLIVGLGNPGRAYEHTRHNVGFDVLDKLAGKGGAEFRKRLLSPVHTAEMRVGSESLLLVKPQAFMNRSGPPVGALMRKRGVAPADLVVVVDDVDLSCGQLRIRARGSAGGHKGLKSVIEHVGTEEFVRIRVGVGRPAASASRKQADEPGEGDMVKHVLSRFAPDERDVIREAIERAADAVAHIVEYGVDKAMNEFNG